jgi:hypothetical protein
LAKSRSQCRVLKKIGKAGEWAETGREHRNVMGYLHY